jgi:hypothetical protein
MKAVFLRPFLRSGIYGHSHIVPPGRARRGIRQGQSFRGMNPGTPVLTTVLKRTLVVIPS